MRRTALTLTLAMVVGLFPGTATASEPAPIDPWVLQLEGRQSALIHIEPGATLESGVAAARSAGLDVGTTYPPINVFVAYGETQQFLAAATAPEVEWIESNLLLEFFTDTSHVATRGQEVLDGAITLADGSRIDGSGVGVAVVDSGVDGTHPDLADRMGSNVRIVCTAPGGAVAIGGGTGLGFSECRAPKAAVPMDDTDTPGAGGHGTHVAGIVAGTGAASGGRFHGAAPGATLYGVGVGTTLVVENALDGLRWVLDNHDRVDPAIRVVNNSWGSGHRTATENDPLTGAVTKMQNALLQAGVTVVFAAGNSGGSGTTATTSVQCVNLTPGNVCVANYNDANSGTRDGSLSSSSSRGKADDPSTWPDISAPGSTIVSTCRVTLPVCWAHTGQVLDPPNTYSTLSGTSMAAPHIAGIAAQLYQVDPTLTPGRVEDVLEDTAHKFTFGGPYASDPFNPDNLSSFDKGHGLVDVMVAVQSLLGTKVKGSKKKPRP
jgi:serine protease AprX